MLIWFVHPFVLISHLRVLRALNYTGIAGKTQPLCDNSCALHGMLYLLSSRAMTGRETPIAPLRAELLTAEAVDARLAVDDGELVLHRNCLCRTDLCALAAADAAAFFDLRTGRQRMEHDAVDDLPNEAGASLVEKTLDWAGMVLKSGTMNAAGSPAMISSSAVCGIRPRMRAACASAHRLP